ncbi:MAG TPA: 50S ribosomal protein L11 methyltransferase [Candidatus Limnocylindria bacterium]|jgi:ribosomal protein L11 methyltransferase|nr:50S ribosomal protein L11 methyltransferase [Candidatus Limnocylindria bacterium]
MRWLALSVEADVEAVEAVSEILGRLGRGSVIEPLRLAADPADEQALRPDPAAGYRVTAYVPDDADAAGAVDRTERALWHLQAFDLRPMSALAVTAVDDADWATAWREGYEPIRIGRITIVPTWLEVPADAELVIRLDPGMAFGTGLHPTTRGCLEELQALGALPDAVLDVGCGSGILGLAALALGAERVVGYDTDVLAVNATRQNAEVNRRSGQVTAHHETLPDVATETFPLVLANLVAAVLIELAPRLVAHTAPMGTVIASGIIDTRRDEVETALAAAGLLVADRRVEGEWVTLRLVRSA